MKPSSSDPATGSIRPNQSATWLRAALLAIIGLVYANSVHAPFVFDDFQAITLNPTIRDLSRLGVVLSPPLDGAGVTGRPLVNLSFALNHALGGYDVRGYHVGSIALHALAALMFFGLLRRTFRLPSLPAAWSAQATSRAWWIALLWAIHPLITECVVCVVQRNEILAGLFIFATLYAFVRSTETGASTLGWQALAVGACLLGMASKELVATAPLLVLLYDRTFVAGTFAAAWRGRKFFYGALASTWLLLAFLMAGTDQRAGIVGFGLGMSAWDYLCTQAHALVLYLKLSVWPHPLVVDYGSDVLPYSAVWPQGLLVLALLCATVWALVKQPRWGFVGAWFFVILAPSSSFVPLTSQTIAEHRMYLPLAAVVVAVVFAVGRITPPRRAPWIFAALALAGAGATVARNTNYRDEFALWQQTLRHQPTNARTYANLGDYHRRHGERDLAIAAYQRATELRAGFAEAHSELGSLLLEAGRVDEALAQNQLAVRLRPASAPLRHNLGVTYQRAGNLAAAVAEWEEALRLRPDLGATHRRLGSAALTNGDFPRAEKHFSTAAALDPTDAEALDGWGRALMAQEKLAAAAAKLEAARALRPDVAEIHFNLGALRLREGQQSAAVESFREAARLKPAFSDARHTLAMTLAQMGRFSDAANEFAPLVVAEPNSAEWRLTYAVVLSRANRASEAIDQARAAVRLDPQSADARALLQELETP